VSYEQTETLVCSKLAARGSKLVDKKRDERGTEKTETKKNCKNINKKKERGTTIAMR